jgi:DNA-binding response OmpR family regulator
MPEPATRRTVLVVEDDASIRELLRLHLDLAGFAIEEAEDGRRALDRARSTPFDLLLLDVMLPGLDGVTVCRAVRASGPNVDTPILMLTAREGESDNPTGSFPTASPRSSSRRWAARRVATRRRSKLV